VPGEGAERIKRKKNPWESVAFLTESKRGNFKEMMERAGKGRYGNEWVLYLVPQNGESEVPLPKVRLSEMTEK